VHKLQDFGQFCRMYEGFLVHSPYVAQDRQFWWLSLHPVKKRIALNVYISLMVRILILLAIAEPQLTPQDPLHKSRTAWLVEQKPADAQSGQAELLSHGSKENIKWKFVYNISQKDTILTKY